jgi:uncharacterized protein (DUF433 family)
MADEPTYVDEDGRTVHRTEYPHIVRVEGLRSGRPVIDGTGFEVQHIVGYYYKVGMTIEQIAAEWDYLPLPAIFSALAYYHDHREEIDRIRYESSYEYWQAQQPVKAGA